MKKHHIYVICFIVLVIDQSTKFLITKNLNVLESLPVIPSFFSIHYIQNFGAAWGILENQVFLLSIVSAVAFIFINRYLQKIDKLKKTTCFAYGLLLGGILGNFVDRIVLGHVIDFLDFQIINYNFPVFNIADVAIVIGMGLLIIDIIWGEKHEHKGN